MSDKTTTPKTDAEASPKDAASFGQVPNRLVEVGRTSRGYTIYREANGVGGHSYWSDSIGGGVIIYDTCLASREKLELALKIEREFSRGER